MDRSTPVRWEAILSQVVRNKEAALRWGFPEPWVQTEMFTALEGLAGTTGWQPLPMEVPYVTRAPVTLPKEGRRDWESEGAVKWIDLCLRSSSTNEWLWVELKVRHAGVGERALRAALDARNAFRKDIVALLALDPARTADLWREPDVATSAYWFEEALKPISSELRAGRHFFTAIYLHLGGSLDEPVWGRSALDEAVAAWWKTRTGVAGRAVANPGSASIEHHQLINTHSVVVASGAIPNRRRC